MMNGKLKAKIEILNREAVVKWAQEQLRLEGVKNLEDIETSTFINDDGAICFRMKAEEWDVTIISHGDVHSDFYFKYKGKLHRLNGPAKSCMSMSSYFINGAECKDVKSVE